MASLLGQMFKDKYVGAIAPSSRFMRKKIFKHINFHKDNVIVEFGPGTGAYTKYLLKKMSPASQLIVIETNKELCEHLSEEFPDKRLTVLNDSADNVVKILNSLGVKADYVLSGIPFSMFPKELRYSIAKHTKQALNIKGKFIVYQFMPHCVPPLEKYFTITYRDLEIINIPPFFIYVAE